MAKHAKPGANQPYLTIYPERTALLVLHPMNEQLKYRAGKSMYGPGFPEANRKLGIIEKTKGVIEASREKGVPVIYVRMSYRDRAGYPELPRAGEVHPERGRLREKGMYREGSWNTRIVEELAPKETDIVVLNNSASGFGYNDLEIILRNRDIRYLVMVGLSTKTIVTCTTIDAFNKGFYNYILKDCCNSRKPGEHELYVTEVLPSYAVVIDSARYLAALEATGSGTAGKLPARKTKTTGQR